MKKLIIVLFASLPLTLPALEAPIAFPDIKIDLPPLSLAGDALQGVPSLVNQFRPVERVTRVSRIPIIVPPPDLDPKIVRTPDPSIDFRMLVKAPDVDKAR